MTDEKGPSVDSNVLTLPKLESADSSVPPSLVAIDIARVPPPGSRNNPVPFRCAPDGRVYWIKPKDMVPGGLMAELIAGRLGQITGFAPAAATIVVPAASLPEDGNLSHFEGTGVGTQDVPHTENSKNLHALADKGRLIADKAEHKSWMQAVVFQSWIGMSPDPQVLINLSTGRVTSIDHEDSACRNPTPTPQVVEASIMGIALEKKSHGDAMREAIGRVEAVTDQELIGAVALGIEGLNTDRSQRLRIAEALAARRDALRSVMEKWIDQ